MTPYYEDSLVTLYHADCAEVLPSMADVDLIFTSPPYNLNCTTKPGGGFDGLRKGTARAGKWHGGDLASGYADHGDDMPMPEYEEWQRDVLRACWATLNDHGAIFYNHKPRPWLGEVWLPIRLNPELPLRQVVIWARAGGINFSPSHYCPTHEWLLVLAKPEFRLKSKAASGLGDVWYVPQEASEHPAPFPLGLPARAIESVAPSLVLDPFAGSGTTLRAAKDAGVRAVGIELSEKYCEMAALRLGQESLFGAAA
ncbi:MAG TPA: site-specific DNA-methyltransferase [Vicinamibacterales bacterium]|nr:site-specific DNA-methyltransferase [Vicinamibacterales bacterium]